MYQGKGVGEGMINDAYFKLLTLLQPLKGSVYKGGGRVGVGKYEGRGLNLTVPHHSLWIPG